jgi:hypothetical protein
MDISSKRMHFEFQPAISSSSFYPQIRLQRVPNHFVLDVNCAGVHLQNPLSQKYLPVIRGFQIETNSNEYEAYLERSDLAQCLQQSQSVLL